MLPETGFAPETITRLSPQPDTNRYASLGGMWLEIPRLGLELPIVGVPLSPDGWDLSWLNTQIGYLNGTTFPTWQGNTGLTGHTYLSNGTPGPFSGLKDLSYGDRVIVHSWGQAYTYEVRESFRVAPGALDVLQPKDHTWLTLLTCQGYQAKTGEYTWRLAVQAVLVGIKDE
jgi:LPXTG-site transpeptidase (sortase) family protein